MSFLDFAFMASFLFALANVGIFLVGVTIILIVAMVREALDWPGGR